MARPKVAEPTTLGAAYLAGLAEGLWKNRRGKVKQRQADRTFRPAMKLAKRKQPVAGREKAWAWN